MSNQPVPTAPAAAPAKFEGYYVPDIELAVKSSLVSGNHALLIGPPGCGKTDIAVTVMRQMTADGLKWKIFRLSPSTPPETVEGGLDIGKALAVPSQFVTDTSNTFNDVTYHSFIADEVGRTSEPVQDSLLHALERHDLEAGDLAPVVVCTSNFMPETKRAEAMVDRIPTFVWVEPGKVDPRAIGFAALQSNRRAKVVDCGLPQLTVARMLEIRREDPAAHPDSCKAVVDIIEALAAEAEKEKFTVNARRITQWSVSLWKTAAWLSGSFDFTTVPPTATNILKWMWPALRLDQAKRWQQVASACADTVGTAIERMKAEAVKKLGEIKEQKSDVKTRMIAEFLVRQEEEFKTPMIANDPRSADAMKAIKRMIANVLAGKDAM